MLEHEDIPKAAKFKVSLDELALIMNALATEAELMKRLGEQTAFVTRKEQLDERSVRLLLLMKKLEEQYTSQPDDL